MLPDTVQGAIISRFDRLALNEQLVLKVASVIGREFDARILEHIYPVEETGDDVAAILETLSGLDIVVREGPDPNHHVFRHVLSQEAVYGVMLFSQRRELHKRVAEWYERGPEHELAARYPLLAHHWTKSEDAGRAIKYLHLAGEHALADFANLEAVRFFERALDIWSRHADDASDGQVTDLERGLAEGHYRSGDFDACRTHGHKALRRLGRPAARGAFGLVTGLVGQVIWRIVQSFRRRPSLEHTVEARARRLAAVRVHNRFSEIAVFAEESIGCVYSALRELNLAEPAGPTPELGRAYAVMSIILGTVPLPRVADAWVGRAIETADQLEQKLHRAWIYSRCGAYELYRARWSNVHRLLGVAIETSEQLADRRLREESLAILGLALHYQGDFAQSEEVMARVAELARGSGNAQTRAWGLMGRGQNLVRLGRAGEALPLFEEVGPWLAERASRSERIWGHGMHALARLRAGQPDAALETAERAMQLIVGSRPVAYWTQQSNAAVTEVYATLFAADSSPALRRRLRQATKAMSAFGRVFLFGRAAGHYWRAIAFDARGRRAAAIDELRRCVEIAERYQMHFELGLAHRDLGRWLPSDDPARADHLERGSELLADLGAKDAA